MVSEVGVRWGEPTRDGECSFCLPPSQCRSFIDGLVEARAGATDGRREGVGRWWKGEERSGNRGRRKGAAGGGLVWFGSRGVAGPTPAPQRPGPWIAALWGGGRAPEPDIGYGHGAARSWRGLQVGANRPARARQPRRCQ
jgi:hypothetical protein